MIGQRAAALRNAQIRDYGCAFLCGVMLAHETGDPGRAIRPAEILRWYKELNAAGVMQRALHDYRPGCFIMNWGRMVNMMGGNVTFQGHAPADHDLEDNQRAIELWRLERPETNGWWFHFVYGNYDPWVRSVTRRDGELDSLRVFALG